MKISEIRKKSREEILKDIKGNREYLAELSFNLSLKKVKNTTEIRQIKKNIARMLTILKEKNHA